MTVFVRICSLKISDRYNKLEAGEWPRIETEQNPPIDVKAESVQNIPNTNHPKMGDLPLNADVSFGETFNDFFTI